MEVNKTQKVIHTVNIYAREKIEVVGVNEVLSSTEKEVVAKLDDGQMIVFGSGMTISKLAPEEGLLIVSGTINGIKYENKASKKSFFGKVFK